MLKRLLMICLLFPLLAQAEEFVEGKDYQIITPSVQSGTSKILVAEFFSYGCPWCYKLEPTLDKWAKEHSDKVEFKRIPVVFNKDWGYYAKAYYTAELLNQGDKLNPLLFKAVQVDRAPLNSNQAMIDFFVSHGIDKETAESAFNHSTTLDMKMNEGNAKMAQFRINAVPAFVINGQYKTDLQMAQSEERLVALLNYLVNQVHTAKK